jgi:preprotein translocase subunit SecE
VADEASKKFSLREYIQETRAELRKVIWPTREEATNLTIVVVVVTVVMTIILGGMDWVFSQLFRLLLNAVGG